MLDDSEPLPGFEWETMAETLEKSNISWRVIQELDNVSDPAVVSLSRPSFFHPHHGSRLV